MITLRVKPNDFLQIESNVSVRRVTVFEDASGSIFVKMSIVAGKDFCGYPAYCLSISNGYSSRLFNASVASIDFSAGIVEFEVDFALDEVLFFVTPIWRDFTRDAIVKFRDASFDPSLRG